jgi:hypothetical protein
MFQSLVYELGSRKEMYSIYLSNSLWGGVRPLIHVSLSKRTLGPVWRFVGAPKNAVRDPCFNFFADGEETEAEREEAAFLLTFIATNEETVVDRALKGGICSCE